MNPAIVTWQQIEPIVSRLDLVATMEEAFVAYSQKRAVIPPVGELTFRKPPGDVHLKYGYLTDGDYYVVKIASGFYDNPKLGIPSSQGLMLLFQQATGQLAAILLDEGNLTDLRTAAAGAVAAKHLGPKAIECIGIVGTGIQALKQLQALKQVTPCRKAVVWGRRESHVHLFLEQANSYGFDATEATTLEHLCSQANLITTTTPATTPLIQSKWVQEGTHITAVGADTPSKQELEAPLLGRATRVVVDSRSQSQTRGEAYQAVESKTLNLESVAELGEIIAGAEIGRAHSTDITIADLTGVAVQDLAIAQAVFLEANRTK